MPASVLSSSVGSPRPFTDRHASRKTSTSVIHAPATTSTGLVRALKPLKPYPRGASGGRPFDWSAATLRAGLNFTLTTTAGALDLLGEVANGGAYESLLRHTVTVTLFGSEVKVLDLEWLIRTKRAAGRARDFEAIAELEALREEAG